MLLPRAISYYRSVKNSSRQHGLPIVPLPANVSRALVVLAAVVAGFLVKSLPFFAPENLFQATQSRLQIPVDVLFTRLASLRPEGVLTASDAALRAKFVNLESRLLYLQFGPSVLADCVFCSSDDPRSYFYYALPDLLAPHLWNLVVLVLTTSASLSGRAGSSWRTTATLAAVAIALLDTYLVNQYNTQANARALRLGDLDCFFWSARAYRCAALAALDAVLGSLVYLTGTNRAFAIPPTGAERVEKAVRALAGVKSKLNAVGIVKNTALRDEELRARNQMYWNHEVRVMREAMEEREVIEGVNDALQNRINMAGVMKDAEAYADGFLRPLPLEQRPIVVG